MSRLGLGLGVSMRRRAAAGTPATVELIYDATTAYSSAPYDAPYNLAKTYDNNGATFFAAIDNTSGHVGYDAGSGNTVAFTGLFLYPRSTGDGHEIRLTGAVIEQASAQGGSYTQCGTVARYLAPGGYTYCPITGAPASRCLRIRRDGEYCDVSEIRIEGRITTGSPAYRPARPRFDNPGPMYVGRVAIASPTTTASVYYTLDGTTPDTTKTLYTGPVTVANGQTLKAVAYLASATSVYSEVVSRTYQTPRFVVDSGASLPGSTSTAPGVMYDDNGNPINCHGGGIVYDPVSEYYYWHGAAFSSDAAVLSSLRGVQCYRSRDLYQWEYRGVVFTIPATLPDSTAITYCERPKCYYVPTANTPNKKYVIWCHGDTTGYTNPRGISAFASSPEGPFTLSHYQILSDDSGSNTVQSFDCTVFMDLSENNEAWFISDGKYYNGTGTRITRAFYLNTPHDISQWASSQEDVTTTSVGEGHVMFRHTDGNVYYLYSSYSGYGSNAFTPAQRSGPSMQDLNAATPSSIYSTAPAALSALASGQTSAIVRVEGREGYILLMDTWDARASGTTVLTRSRNIFMPVPDTAFAAGRIQIAPVSSWSLSGTLPPS